MVTATSSTTSPADSASVGSALATAIGGGTGLDMTALAGNLADAQFAGRLARIDSQSEKLTAKISAATQLKSDLLTLATSFGNAVRSGNLSAQPSVANAAVASASLPLGSSGASGSYSLEVTALAAPQVLSSAAFTSGTALAGSGSLTIAFGKVAGGAFTADAGHAPVTISIAAGATLSDVASAINRSGAGVTAYVATGSDGARLVMKGQQGQSNGFTVTANEDPADPGLSRLAFDPAVTPAVPPTSATLAASAADASYKLDGIARTSPGNVIANAAPGLSLKLTGTNVGAPTQVTFSDPAANIASSMDDFTSAINTLVQELNTDLDPLNGPLSSDTGGRSLRAKLSQLTSTKILPDAPAGAPSTLGDLGMAVNKDGTFRLDTTKLNAALAKDPQAVAAMFTNGLNGIYGTLDRISRSLSTAGDPGSLGGSVARYTEMQTKLSKQRGDLVTQQDKLRTQLITRFAHSNALVAGSKSTLTYLQNQVTAWSNGK